MSEDRAKTPLLIAEFIEICRRACAQLNAHATAPPSRDDYWRAMCEHVGERIAVDPAVLMPSDDYPLALSELAGIAGLDEHNALSAARNIVENAVERRRISD
jgi:hypothetical protein